MVKVEKVNEFVIEQNEKGEQEDAVINCISELLTIMTVAEKYGEITARIGELFITVYGDRIEIDRVTETRDEYIGGMILQMRVSTPDEMFKEVK